MKNLVTRCGASLCMAAGALAALPAQAFYSTNVVCTKSIATTKNPGYSSCSGPIGSDTGGGLLTGSQSERDDLRDTFGVDPAVGMTIPFTYLGKSSDSNGGPFTGNPGTAVGTLTFDPAVSASVSGTFFVLGFESESLNNYSYYLFDSRAFPTLSVAFDTLGITDSAGGQPQPGVRGPNLGFAGLYVQLLPTGGNVPEPSGIALITAAFGALALTTRRRRS